MHIQEEANTKMAKKEASARLALIQHELEAEIKKFPSRTIGLAALSERTRVSERTLRRVLKGTHVPNFKTMLKVFKYLSGSMTDLEAIMTMPEIVKKSIFEDSDNFSLKRKNVELNEEVDFYLQKDSVFRSIYLETATGDVTTEKVGFKHGQHGLNILDKMVELNVVKEISPGSFTGSTNRARIDNETIHELSTHLIQHEFKPDKLSLKGENFCQTLFEGVDAETYNELLKVDWESKEKRVAIVKDFIKNDKKGNIKYWHASFTDTLSENLIYDDHSLPSKREVIQ